MGRLVLGLTLAAFAALAAIALVQDLGGDGDDGGSDASQTGDPPQTETAPEDVARDFTSAVVEGDGRAACGEATSRLADQLAEDTGVKTCERAVEDIAATLAESTPKKVLLHSAANSTYEVLEEFEDGAVVRVIPPPESEGTERIVYLIDEDGTWLIDG